jgi:hypothetical protein
MASHELHDELSEYLEHSPGPQVRGILVTASRIGFEFSSAALKILVDLPEGEILHALETAVAAGLVVELPRDGRYAFKSTALHETLQAEGLAATRPGGADEGNAFYREGDYWTIRYDGRVLRMKDVKGLRYISRLLGDIGEDLPATELVEALQGGKPDQEQARLSVSRAVKAAIEKIEREHPALGRHLTTTIRAGKFCSYVPDPRVGISWRL